MNENKAVPNIRFNDFENKWEKKKLNQIVKKVTRKNIKLQTSLSLTISAERGIINQNLFFNRQIASRDMSNYFLIKQGEFAYNKSYSKSAPFGTIKRLNRYNQGALSSLYIVFGPTKVNSDYLVSYFDSSYWYKQLSMISTEGVRNHGLLNVSPNDFFDMNLSIPHDDKEQQKIGNFFTKLDKLLDLQQQKIEKLELLKKALLQKLFPKHDSKVPELRFKEFNDEWKSMKIGSLFDHKSGTSIEKYFNSDGKYKVISIGSYGKNSKYIDQGIRVNLNSVTKSHLVDKNDLTMVLNDKTPDGQIIGRVLLINKSNEFVINQRTERLIPRNINSKFAFTYLNGPIRKSIKKMVQGGTQIYINYSSIEKIDVLVPKTIEEQQKIGNLLSKVDQLIELEKKKLQNLQQVKKCLLQNMFVE